jgi:hypothetical protein
MLETVKDTIRSIADGLTSLIGVVPKVAAYAVAAVSTAAEAVRKLIDVAATAVIAGLDAAAEALVKIADKLDDAFSE